MTAVKNFNQINLEIMKMKTTLLVIILISIMYLIGFLFEAAQKYINGGKSICPGELKGFR